MSNYFLCDTCTHCGGLMRGSSSYIRCFAKQHGDTYVPSPKVVCGDNQEPREACKAYRRASNE